MGRKLPEDTIAQEIAKIIHFIIPYLLLPIVGTLIWGLTYLCLYFYKEVFICYVKRNIKFEGVSYYNKYKEYLKYMPKFLIFNAVIIVFWVTILLADNEWRFFILKSGFCFFIITYVCSWVIYYRKHPYLHDYLDDYYFFVNYIKNGGLVDKDVNDKKNVIKNNSNEKAKIE